MGGSAQRDPNVIIPDIGAGKYWYVDPRAGTPSQPQQAYGAQSSIEHPSIDVMKAVQRLINPNPQQQVQASHAMSRMNMSDEDYNKAYEAHERSLDATYGTPAHKMGPKDVFKTVGININGEDMEVPAVFDNMSEYENNIITYLPHTQWPKWIMDKIENTVRDNLEQGMDAFGNRAEDAEDLKKLGIGF